MALYIGNGNVTPIKVEEDSGIDSLSITPLKGAQTVTASGTNPCFQPVTISGVTSSVDSNIQPMNIDYGVNILGVTGNYFPIQREVVDGKYQMPTSEFSFDLPTEVNTIESYGLSYAFYGSTGLTSADLSSVVTIESYGLEKAFQGCTNLTSVDLSSLLNLGEYALYGAFQNCTSLTSLSFPSLMSTSFGSYTSQFNNMLVGVTGCTVHFPSNLQSVIGEWSSVTGGFGGTNTVILYDLPATDAGNKSLTVVTNPTSATCSLTYGGNTYSTKKVLVTPGTNVSYSIYQATYGTTTGSVTVDSNKVITATGVDTPYYSLDSDITVYNSPTITGEGVCYNLGTSNRLVYSTSSMSNTNWEVQMKFQCSAATSSYQAVIGRGSNSTAEYGFRILVGSDGYLYATCYNGSKIVISSASWLIVGKGWCIINASYKNSVLKVTLQREADSYATNTLYNSTVSSATTWNPSQAIGCQTYASSSSTWSRHYGAVNCTVDLQEFYIKSNDSYVINNKAYTHSWSVTES